MSKKARLLAAVILIITGLFGGPVFDLIKNNVDIDIWPNDNPVVVVVDEPSLQYQDMVQDIVDIDISKQHADTISPFFAEVASVIETDPGFLKSTGQFRDFNVMSGGLHFAGLDTKGEYPNLGTSVDSAIVSAIGKKNEPLDDEKRKSLVSILRAISWGIRQ